MNLGQAAALLGESNRHFVDVYKLYNFKDDTSLRVYLDFVKSEPAEWMRGFPNKLRTHTTFALPKTAMIKLLKLPAVIDACGQEFVHDVYTAVWQTYKKQGHAILEERLRSASVTQQQQRKQSPSIEDFMESADISDSESIHSDAALPVPVPPAAAAAVSRVDGERVIHFTSASAVAASAAHPVNTFSHPTCGCANCDLLVGVVRDLLLDIAQTHPGLAASTLRLVEKVCPLK